MTLATWPGVRAKALEVIEASARLYQVDFALDPPKIPFTVISVEDPGFVDDPGPVDELDPPPPLPPHERTVRTKAIIKHK